MQIKTHILRPIMFFRKACCLWNTWKSMLEADKRQMTI